MIKRIHAANLRGSKLRSFTVIGLLGLAACSSGRESTTTETALSTEATASVSLPPSTTEAPTTVSQAPSTSEASTTISQATTTSEVLGGLVAYGTVTCPDGMQVTGVWVETAQEDRGWAEWQPHANDTESADYSRNLDNSEGYGLKVGCGGTRESWGQSIQVDGLIAGIPAVLICGLTPSESTAQEAYACVSKL